uniref:Uncharacterized protein n=1 Tax=Micrurus lemniscatus lemniscatus TaxID=129467 RepID=A0A2D4IMW3_MICLE
MFTGKGGCRRGKNNIHGEGMETWKSSVALKSHTIKCSQFEVLKHFPTNVQSHNDEKTILEVYIAQHSEAALGFAHLYTLCATRKCMKSQVSGNHLILLVLFWVEDLSRDIITKSI